MVEFDQFKNEAGRHAFTMSPQKWIRETNAELIRMNIKQSYRLIQLNESARNQMEALKNNKNIKELEVLQQQVNDEDNKYLIESK